MESDTALKNPQPKWLFYQIYFSYLFITLLTLVIFIGYISQTTKSFYLQHVQEDLAHKANIVQQDLMNSFKGLNPEAVDSFVKPLGERMQIRITVILASGDVIGDSMSAPAQMENHAKRPEVIKALQGEAYMVERYSQTLQQNMVYSAQPFYQGPQVVAVVRTAIPLAHIEESLESVYFKQLIAWFVIVAVALIVGFWVAKKISKPLQHIQKLEGIRKEFVANVSHELKTPVTSIKGAAETLIDQGEAPEDRQMFLDMIVRNARRLHKIIEDLLTLSRIEQDDSRETIELEETFLLDTIHAAVRACEVQSQRKSIEVEVSCPTHIKVLINPPLLEQAVVNLLDNAIKYSDAHTKVRVAGMLIKNANVIHIYDQGPGIAEKNLSRIFERFYRIDKARSRKLGGTGLGLAIVKHIAQLHGGRVEVSSLLGEGSRFSIILPV